MNKTTLRFLPENWQGWVVENVARGCTPESIVASMVNDGRFDQSLAEYAVAEGFREHNPAMFTPPALPDIDTTENVIHIDGRDIMVLVSIFAPRIVLLGNVLSGQECDAVIEMSNDRFSRCTVLGQIDGSHDDVAFRTSESATLVKGEATLIATIDARIAALVSWPVEHAEHLQVQKYLVGNQYRPHHDWFDPKVPLGVQQMATSGQRMATLILYLSDVEAGGGTSFPCIGLDVHPQKGNALFFLNTNPYGVPEQRTLHAGLPVEKGRKVIANKWFRERAH